MNTPQYRICKRCIMDTSDPEISFDTNGICKHCTQAYKLAPNYWFPDERGERYLSETFARIKKECRKKEYDCIIGLSGGVDSSYLVVKAAEYGLRPLIVHVDCGWNSELAVKNIENLVKKLNFELHTHVVNWLEMKDMQRAFFKANVPNQDIPQDHAIFAAMYNFAIKHNIKYVLTGSNFSTECILPQSWGYEALDWRHIVDVHKKFGERPLKTYPYVTFLRRYIYFNLILGMKVVKPLNYMRYNKEAAMQELTASYGWRYYGGKHHESRFTKFFQAHYLPAKFGYDKRRAHLSSMIVSGLMTREQALLEIEKPLYDPTELVRDLEYVAKKLDFTPDEMHAFIKAPNKRHHDYANIEHWFKIGLKVRSWFIGR